ncbi:MAG: hypothetical protein EBX50_01720, partial [Chitinophagia bacterium]|nr:hypothetical protein [Chitinophagia bacterium]
GKIDAQDFKIMQGQQDEEECMECGQSMEEDMTEGKETCEKCGKEICECWQSMEEEEVTEEKECCKKCGKEICECGNMYESKKFVGSWGVLPGNFYLTD